MGEPVLVTRRAFLVGLNLTLGGLALGVFPRGRALAAGADVPPGALAPNPFVYIAPDGATTIVCARSEMGQGVRSSLPALMAAELGADPRRVHIVQAVGDKRYGDQNTDGSSSVRGKLEDLRRTGATARAMLVSAAAKRWKVKPETCDTRDHEVVHVASKRTLPFSALVAAAAKLPVPAPDKLRLRSPEQLAAFARDLPLVDAPAYVTGAAVFGADVKLPGLLVAVIARPPVVGGRVVRHDERAALAVPGVKQVVLLPPAERPFGFKPWGGVAVIATNTWAALKGRAALEITWEQSGADAAYDSDAYRRELDAAIAAPGTPARNLGDIDAALASAARVVEADYHVPHLAHLPMEPPVATARVGPDGTCEIWAPTQDPQTVRAEAAKLLGVGEDKVTVNVTLLGGGFGRKSKADFTNEAVLLARAAGAPVRVQWTREDDLEHGYYNAVSAQRLTAGLDASGKVVAWRHRTAFPPISSTFGDASGPAAGDLQQGVLDLALAVPNVRAETCAARAYVRIGWFRSVYNIFHAFAIGSFVDEIAHARGQDPRDTWLEIIGPPRTLSLADLGVESLRNYRAPLEKHPVDAGRLRRVIERVTELASWSRRKQAGRTLGLAAHRSFLSYTGVVISVVPDPVRKLRIDEAWIVMDPGTIVNADRVRAQLQGSVVMGISNAMYGGITMKQGVTQQSSFRDARVARIADVPRKLHVDIIASTGEPCGVGEPGVPPVAPAIANAIFALTGRRLRNVPLGDGVAKLTFGR